MLFNANHCLHATLFLILQTAPHLGLSSRTSIYGDSIVPYITRKSRDGEVKSHFRLWCWWARVMLHNYLIKFLILLKRLNMCPYLSWFNPNFIKIKHFWSNQKNSGRPKYPYILQGGWYLKTRPQWVTHQSDCKICHKKCLSKYIFDIVTDNWR